jgi:hypothetical protein
LLSDRFWLMVRTHTHTSRLWTCAVITLVALAGALSLSGSASADSVSLAVLDAAGKSDPVQDIGRTFDFTVTASSNTYLYVAYRPTGGPACAPTVSSDSGSSFLAEQVTSGTQHIKQVTTFSARGSFLFCMWLGPSSSQAQTILSQKITFRAPRGSISFTSTPRTVGINKPVKLTFSGVSEAPRGLYVTWRKSGGAGCAPTYSSDSGSGIVDGENVNGSFRITSLQTFSERGSYVFCAWIAKSSSDTDPIAGPKRFAFNVGIQTTTKVNTKRTNRRMSNVDVRVAAAVVASSIIVKSLVIVGVQPESLVVVQCFRGCTGTERFTSTAGGTVKTHLLVNKKLPRGAIIKVFLAKKGWIGYYANLRVDPRPSQGQLTVRREACLPRSGSLTPVKC